MSIDEEILGVIFEFNEGSGYIIFNLIINF